MMKLNQFLEKKGEKAHRDAIAMGLQYKGFGYWADPNSGEAKYKTVNDQLVPVTPDEESELYKGDEKEGMPAMSGTPQQGGMAQPGADQAQQPSVGSGDAIQGGLGVDANAPQKKGWDAGPDGDTCVGGQPREEVPSDTFVGKTNNLQWTAGMDGSNAVTELGEMRKMILDSIMEQGQSSFDRELARKFSADRKIRNMQAGNTVSEFGKETESKVKKALKRGSLKDDQIKIERPSDKAEREKVQKRIADEKSEMDRLMGTRQSKKSTRGSEVGKGDGPTRAKKVAKAVRGKDVSKMGSDTKGNVDYINKAGSKGQKTNALHSFMLDWGADPTDDDPDYTGAVERDYQRGESQRQREREAEWKANHGAKVAQRLRMGSLNRKMGGAPDGEETRRDAEYLKNMPTGQRTPAMRQAMAAMGADPNIDPLNHLNRSALRRLAQASGNPEEVKAALQGEVKKRDDDIEANRQIQYDKDQEVVQMMNDTLKNGGYFADPEYDMDNLGEKIGEGAFGSVFMGADGDSVIKEGMIGQEELAVLRKLRDNPMFPTLLNAQMQSPFSHESSIHNNPRNKTDLRRPEGQSKYFDPDEQGEFEDRFPSAFGKYAMSLAKGRDLMDVVDELYENGDENDEISGIYEKVFRARREMHKAGIAHNDMHGGNIKIDDDGNINIIDLGLAEENPLAALFEGMGGISGYDGQFAMGAAPGGFGNMVGDHTSVDNDNRFRDNLGKIEEMMMDNIDIDMDDEDAITEKMGQLQEFLRGGIRKTKDTWPRLREQFPYLDNDENVMGLIEQLYDGFGENPTAQRMGAAFDRLKNTSNKVNDPTSGRRLRQGEPLVPPDKFDLDDQFHYYQKGWLLEQESTQLRPQKPEPQKVNVGQGSHPLLNLSKLGKSLGQGDNAVTYEGPENSAIKVGKVGKNEAEALGKLKGMKGFPGLMNADLTQDMEDSNTLNGSLAMNRISGNTLDPESQMPDDKKRDLMNKLMMKRKEMHEKGVAHGDFHRENLLQDDEGDVSVLDFGKASLDPIAAYKEAMGATAQPDEDIGLYMNGDAQFMNEFGDLMDDDLKGLLGKNKQSVTDLLRDEGVGDITDALINNNKPDYKKIRENNPYFADDKNVMKLIKMFYNGIGEDNSLQARMARAVDSGKIPQKALDIDN